MNEAATPSPRPPYPTSGDKGELDEGGAFPFFPFTLSLVP